MGKDFVAIRRANLLRLIARDYGGNQSALARDLDSQQSYVNGLLKGTRAFGEKAASRIEELASLEEGQLSIEGGPLQKRARGDQDIEAAIHELLPLLTRYEKELVLSKMRDQVQRRSKNGTPHEAPVSPPVPFPRRARAKRE